jgi:hypothetical protein
LQTSAHFLPFPGLHQRFLGDFSFTRVIGLLEARTTCRKEVILSVAQDFRKLAQAVDLRIILALIRIAKLVKLLCYSYVVAMW